MPISLKVCSWFEKLKNTGGIYEFRKSDHQKFYRILAFWDSEEKETLIVATHGIDKKSTKTPSKEIMHIPNEKGRANKEELLRD